MSKESEIRGRRQRLLRLDDGPKELAATTEASSEGNDTDILTTTTEASYEEVEDANTFELTSPTEDAPVSLWAQGIHEDDSGVGRGRKYTTRPKDWRQQRRRRGLDNGPK